MPPTDDDVKAARELSRCSNAPQCWLCGEYFKPCRGCVEANRIALVISAARERGAREEREACAEYVDLMTLRFDDVSTYTLVDIQHAARNVAAAIRARADK